MNSKPEKCAFCHHLESDHEEWIDHHNNQEKSYSCNGDDSWDAYCSCTKFRHITPESIAADEKYSREQADLKFKEYNKNIFIKALEFILRW